jgi:acyl-CoA thioesterase
METLRQMMARDRFAAGAAIRLEEVGEGRARARMEAGDDHLNGVDIVQGGAIFTLADFTFAAACNSSGAVAVAVNVSISFVKAAHPGTLTAVAEEVSRSKRLSTCTVKVTDATGDLVALFTGTAFRTSRKVGEGAPES